MSRKTRLVASVLVALVVTIAVAPAAGACGSLIAPNGAVNLVRTSTLVAYHEGVEHYVTSFEFTGSPETFGSIIPLPDEPTTVERAGDWTLQRLQREVNPTGEELDAFAAPSAARDVEVLQQVRIDSLDVTILRGGARGVADWANQQGFALPADTPEVLRFYAKRSPYFMAAKFDATAAAEDGFRGGDGIPVHLAIPTDDPWVPLRILGAAKVPQATVEADVFLLTDRRPSLLHGPGFTVERSERASQALLDDLRSDERSEWVPERAWLTYATVDAKVPQVIYDLAIDADGGRPRVRDTGVRDVGVLVYDLAPPPPTKRLVDRARQGRHDRPNTRYSPGSNAADAGAVARSPRSSASTRISAMSCTCTSSLPWPFTPSSSIT
jgi:hypothetical protein